MEHNRSELLNKYLRIRPYQYSTIAGKSRGAFNLLQQLHYLNECSSSDFDLCREIFLLSAFHRSQRCSNFSSLFPRPNDDVTQNIPQKFRSSLQVELLNGEAERGNSKILLIDSIGFNAHRMRRQIGKSVSYLSGNV